MKQENDVELQYQGATDEIMITEQLDAAIRALHVLAVLKDNSVEWMNSYALEALKEIEALGYNYELHKQSLN
tara:strand:- start:762 stop:977 length:216 start_codon:yes stop_codon:yes gene_type:complete